MSDRHQPREIGRKESGSLQQHVHVARLLFRFDCHFVRGIAPMPALPPRAVELLAGLPRLPGNPWVIPGSKPGTHLRQIDDAWRTVRVRAGLHDVRIHDLRHSCATYGDFQVLKSLVSICYHLFFSPTPQPA